MHDLETTVTKKGQVTIPVEVRSRLGLKARDRVIFEVQGDMVKLRPAGSRVLRGYGAVGPRNRPEDWREIRTQVEQSIAREVAAER